jgi:hypothetical protein
MAKACNTTRDTVTRLLPHAVGDSLSGVRAHLLRKLLQALWDDVSPSWAGKCLAVWYTKAARCRHRAVTEVGQEPAGSSAIAHGFR